jgi:hypothetical protein
MTEMKKTWPLEVGLGCKNAGLQATAEAYPHQKKAVGAVVETGD